MKKKQQHKTEAALRKRSIFQIWLQVAKSSREEVIPIYVHLWMSSNDLRME